MLLTNPSSGRQSFFVDRLYLLPCNDDQQADMHLMYTLGPVRIIDPTNMFRMESANTL